MKSQEMDAIDSLIYKLKTAYDFMHDAVTYPVEPTIEYNNYYHNPEKGYDINEHDLYSKDIIFFKTLELIKAEKINKNNKMSK
jgi:hypothetical protein